MARRLFPEIPRICFYANKVCPRCGVVACSTLKAHKTHTRTIATLHIGTMAVYEVVMKCEMCNGVVRSEELAQLVPKNGKFGFDVMVHIGTALFLESKTESTIQADLAGKNVTISQREIGHLGRRFIMYLALAHKDSSRAIRSLISKKGGYILHLDGTCEGDSPHLMTSMDEISEIILNNVKIPSEKAAFIIPLLREIRASYGDPLALVHDMGPGILDAIRFVFPSIPDFICHYHFLRDIGKDLIEAKYTILRKTLKSYGLKTGVRNFVKKLRVKIQRDAVLRENLAACMASATTQEQNNRPPIIAAYLLGLWILDYTNELHGFGFPFDRPHLAFFDRLKAAYGIVQAVGKTNYDTSPFAELYKLLSGIVNDDNLNQHVEDMRKKIAVFEELREIMRIALPENSDGLNDDGTDVDMVSMESRMTEFRKKMMAKLTASKTPDIVYKKMIRQMDKYWDKLFSKPITIQTPDGPITIQPQRTNNILERFFRGLKRLYRKKNGATSLTKTLRYMLADTPLVINLKNPAYVQAILNGADSLESRFAQLEISRVRQMALTSRDEIETTPKALKKLVRLPTFMFGLERLSVGT